MALILESCSVEDLCVSLGGSEKLLNELRQKLREWLRLQPHLPQDILDQRLDWILLGTKLSLEQAKPRLDMYYTIRRLVPEIFAKRDPREPGLASLNNVMQYVALPKLTPDNCRTAILRLTQNDPSKFCPWEVHKYMFMITEILMVEDRSFGIHFVYDLSMMGLGHLMKITPAFLKKCEIVASKAYGARIRGIHLINAPPSVDRLVTLAKSVLKAKLAARIHVHPAQNLESFHQFVPKSILPKDYGGDQHTMDELSDLWRGKMEHYRDWFLESEEILVNERLRPGPTVDADSLFGFSGSFRKLEVD